jgi:hypothetical protein
MYGKKSSCGTKKGGMKKPAAKKVMMAKKMK